MKRLDEYTVEELALLNEEEFERLVKIECMHEGVCEPQYMPKLPELPKMPRRDMKIYSFSFNLCDKDEYEKILDNILECESFCREDYEYEYGYEMKYVKHLTNVKEDDVCSAKEIYSKMAYETHKPIMKARDHVNEEYDDVVDKYRAKSERYDEIRRMVSERYYDAINEINNVDVAVNILKEYIEMSNGSKEIALKFFNNSPYAKYKDQALAKLEESDG